jgi:uncharacterized protein (DUF1778 family)
MTKKENRERLNRAAPEMRQLLEHAAARVKLANTAGNPILSGWLADAEAVLRETED